MNAAHPRSLTRNANGDSEADTCMIPESLLANPQGSGAALACEVLPCITARLPSARARIRTSGQVGRESDGFGQRHGASCCSIVEQFERKGTSALESEDRGRERRDGIAAALRPLRHQAPTMRSTTLANISSGSDCPPTLMPPHSYGRSR